MNVDRAVLAFAGVIVLLSITLAWYFSPYLAGADRFRRPEHAKCIGADLIRKAFRRTDGVRQADLAGDPRRGNGGISRPTARETHGVSRSSLGQVLVGISQSSPRMPRPGTNT
jgi:hypothetical protein